ncbi:type II secretion system protein [Arhodomonas sp. AD133]|uniref:type II secretion system protein n=1 Tax=Arhodomonas sp. AD133 TaxID=3415009 RepID=UPI003EB795C1
MNRLPGTPRYRPCAGYTAVELAVALAVVGVLLWTVGSSYVNVDTTRERQTAVVRGEHVRDAIRAFALANARLPCPDAAGDGWEDTAGGDCPAELDTGFVPYRSLGLTLPDDAWHAQYGVYRRPASNRRDDADLAVVAERGGSGVSRLLHGLDNAAGDGLDAGRIHLTGDGGPAGAIDCGGNRRRHVAYFLVIPLRDRDGDGSRFDSVNAPSAPARCAYAPGTGRAHDRDDVVIAEGFTALAGWLGGR